MESIGRVVLWLTPSLLQPCSVFVDDYLQHEYEISEAGTTTTSRYSTTITTSFLSIVWGRWELKARTSTQYSHLWVAKESEGNPKTWLVFLSYEYNALIWWWCKWWLHGPAQRVAYSEDIASSYCPHHRRYHHHHHHRATVAIIWDPLIPPN